MKDDFYTRTLAACKLWLRRLILRWLRKLVDLADDRLHAAEVKFRQRADYAGASGAAHAPAVRSSKDLAAGAVAVKQSLADDHGRLGVRIVPQPARVEEAGSAGRRRVPFHEWELRRSGVAPRSKKEARRRCGMTASAFDFRFAR